MKTRIMALMLMALISAYGCASAGGAQKAAVPAPDFSVKLIGGGEAALDQFKGKPLVLNIGASWCPHCIHEIPALKKTHEEQDGFEMLVVFVKSPEKDVELLIKKNGLRFKVGIDPDGKIAKAYGVKGIPVTFFIDGQGRIVDDYFGSIEEGTMNEKLEKLKGAK